MKLKSVLFFFLLTGLIACKSKSAFNYSEKIVKIEKSLIPDIERTETQVSGFFSRESYDSAVIVSKRMEDLVDSKIKEIEKFEPPHVNGADNFKQAALKYFSYMKNIYTSYKRYAMQTNEEDREKERQQLLKIVDEKEEAIADMQRAQSRYAEANGLRVDK
jgi:hypothetical protein